MESFELSIHEADEQAEEERSARLGGRQRFFADGTRYVYWRDPQTLKRRAVYNIPPEKAADVVSRIRATPSAAYEQLVGDIPKAGFGDEHATITYVGD